MPDAPTKAKSAKDHYDQLLGPVYSWIIGDFDTAYGMNVELLTTLGIRSGRGASAVDLGCGPGCQTIPLAEAGFSVVAIDFCDDLLDELTRRVGELPVRIVHDDILNFARHLTEPPELVVCMGDTLVHLPNAATVRTLLSDVVSRIRPGGIFVASLRDYSGPPSIGPARFIPVRSSDDRIFTCFLEFRDETIDVHDILHTRVNGEWQLRVSSYQKLRLDFRQIVEFLGAAGMLVDQPFAAHGMMVIRAVKPT
jgi:SAM-dependent methyltransferase